MSIDCSSAKASNPGGSNPGGEGPENALTFNAQTKFVDWKQKPLIIDLGSSTKIDEYTFCTGNDCTERDPISWSLSGSNDAVTWEQIDVRDNYSVTVKRRTVLPYLLVRGGKVISQSL